MFVLILISHGLLNTFGVKLVKLLGDISVWWHVVGVAVIFIVLFVGPDQKQSVSYLFEYQNNSAWSGGISVLYVFFLGFLLAQYTITGYDASAHVSEETVGARTSAPKAIVRSIYISAIAALILNWGFLLATPDDLKNFDASAGRHHLSRHHLRGRARFGDGQAAGVHLGGRSVLLRSRVGDGEQPDDLRVQS